MRLRRTILRAMAKPMPVRKWKEAIRNFARDDLDYKGAHLYDVYIKYVALRAARGTVKNVVLGSSHADFGFWPDKDDFNLGGGSVDLYRSYKLFEWLLANGYEELEHVYLFYDVFSPGFELEKTTIDYVAVPYNILFGVEYLMGGRPFKTCA